MVAQELKSAGINATFQGLSVNAWNADMANGNFQLAEHWSNGGLTPYNLYDNWLDSALAKGTAATGDYERLNNPAIDADAGQAGRRLDGGAADGRPRPDRELRRREPAGHPDHHGVGVVRVQLASTSSAGRPSRTRTRPGQPSGTNNSAGSGTDEVVILHLTPR